MQIFLQCLRKYNRYYLEYNDRKTIRIAYGGHYSNCLNWIEWLLEIICCQKEILLIDYGNHCDSFYCVDLCGVARWVVDNCPIAAGLRCCSSQFPG